MRKKEGNTIITGRRYNNRQLDLMDHHWNTNQLIRNTHDQKNGCWSAHAWIDRQKEVWQLMVTVVESRKLALMEIPVVMSWKLSQKMHPGL
jgi:hypothetical protein